MKCFVTGATGFIGGRVVNQLVAAGHEVVALVRSPDKAQALANMGVTLAHGDITDKESMRETMSGADVLLHIAAWYKIGARDKRPAERINVEGTRNVLELMQELRIPKGVYVSSIAVFSDTRGQLVGESYRYDGPHISEYDRTKGLAHYEVAEPMMEAGLPLVVVQPSAVYGPGDRSTVGESFQKYLQGKLPLLPRETTLCWVHINDVVRGILLAMGEGQPGQSYILAGPAHTLEEAYDLAEAISGVRAPRLRLSPAIMRAMSRLMKIVGAVISIPAPYDGESLRVLAGTTYIASSSKAERELGFKARPLEEGLRETLNYIMRELGMEVKGDE